MASAAAASARSRRFVAVGVLALAGWQTAVLAGADRGTLVSIGLLGFVFHVVFGKAYALVPTYFARDLALPRAPAVQLPLSAAGVACLLVASVGGPPALAPVGAALWTAGVAVFLAALAWTLRDNPTGAETGTGEHNADRRPVDRAANAAVPVALAYLAVGSYALLAVHADLPGVGAGRSGAVHLLAAGCATLLLLAVGFRLLPRFLVAAPPRPLVALALSAGAVGPALLVADFYGGGLFLAGAALEAAAVVGFALAFLALFARSERDRVGFYGVLAGVLSGVAGVALGVGFAAGWAVPGAAVAHLRLNVGGLLGLSVVGVLYQFYPPAVGDLPGADDRTAGLSLAALAGGLWLEAGGRLLGSKAAVIAGAGLGVAGAALVAWLVGAALLAQRRRHGR